MSNNTRIENFARKLCSLYEHFYDPDFDVNEFSAEVMGAFLPLGERDPAHKQYADIVEYGKAVGNDPDEEIYGFKIKGKYIFFAHMLARLEGIPIPDKVLERYPDLTEEEWNAGIRVASLVLMAFNPEKPITPSTRFQTLP